MAELEDFSVEGHRHGVIHVVGEDCACAGQLYAVAQDADRALAELRADLRALVEAPFSCATASDEQAHKAVPVEHLTALLEEPAVQHRFVLTADPEHENSAVLGVRRTFEAAVALWVQYCASRELPAAELERARLLRPMDPVPGPVDHAVFRPYDRDAWCSEHQSRDYAYGMITRCEVPA